MSLILPKTLKLGVLLLVLSVAACSVPKKVSNPYQNAVETSEQDEARPVVELQKKALVALHQNNSRRAIGYLQRAIKIQPRNALSWHYLARSYWQEDDFARCLSMLDRSSSYFSDESLTEANRQLRAQCQ